MATIPFLTNTSFSAAVTVASSATAANFITTTDTGININGISLTRVAANSAIRVGNGLETLGLLRSYAGLTVTGNMSFFETTLTNNDDWQNSPISINERDNVSTNQSADKYAPNLNFHWGGVVSNSLWLGYNGQLNYGSYSSAGIPSADGRINAGTFAGDFNGTINTVTTGTTQTAGNNTTLIATTAFVTTAVASAGAGVFLPLTAGATKKLTNELYIQGTNSTNAESVLLRGVSTNDGDWLGSIRTANTGGYNQEMRFYTSDANGTTNENLVLTLGASQNAAFAGNVIIGSVDSITTGLNIGNASPAIQLFDTTNDAKLLIYTQDSSSVVGTYSNHPLLFFTNSTQALEINTSQNATFAGDVTTNGQLVVNTFLKLGDGGNGYFYSDTDGRTAFNGGEFYIQSGVLNYYNYATNQYHGNSSGDNHFFRSNALSGTNWAINNLGNVGIGTTSIVGKLYVGPTWDTSSGGNDLYIKNTSVDNDSYDPQISYTTNLGITMVTDSATTTGPDTVGLTLYNDDGTAGGFSPMLLFSKLETPSSQYKSSMAGIYARSPLGTGDSGGWIDGELIFATAGAASQGIKQRMVINKEGLVGVGTNAPDTLLHLARTGTPTIRIQDLDGTNQYGDIGHNGGQTIYTSRNNTAFGSHAFYSTNGTTSQLRVKFDETFGVGSSIITASGNAGDSYGGFLGTSDVATVQMWASHGGLIYIGSRTNHDVRFTINNTVEMVLDTSGSLGVGVTDPLEKLDVFGNSITRKKTRGIATNYATSEGWLAGAVSTFTSRVGYFGNNFENNGPTGENKVEYDIGPFNSRELIWKTVPETGNNSDGGWNKNFTALPGILGEAGFMSIVYVKRPTATETSGNFYHGCSGSNTLNLDGNANNNPYFQAIAQSGLPENVWCVSIGIIQANDDANTTGSAFGGIYRLDTGAKIFNASTFKQISTSLVQEHRVYHYYSTSTTAKLEFAQPGFYAMDGSEPTLSDLTAGATSGVGSYLPLAGGTMTTTAKIQFYNTSQYIHATSTNDLTIASGDDINYRSNYNRFFNPGTGTEFARLSGAANSWIANGSNGKLGIGTTTPGDRLEVDGNILLGATDKIGWRYTSGDVSYNFITGQDQILTLTGGTWTTSSTQTAVRINTTQGTKVTVKNSGRVGIGTTDPKMLFHVSTSGTSNAQLGISNSGTGNARLYMDASNGDFVGSDYMSIGQNNDLSGSIEMPQNSGPFHITTGNSYRLTVLQTGKVGIFDTNPVESLSIPSGKGVMLGKKRFFSSAGVVPAGSGSSYNFSASLNEQQGTTLTTQHQYKVYLTTTGTGTYNSAVYIVYQNSASPQVWVSHRVSSTGLTSNYPQLTTSGTNVLIYNLHPNVYSVTYRVETSHSGQALTSPEIFGSDYMWTKDNTDLYYLGGDVGVGTLNPTARFEVDNSTYNANKGIATFINGNNPVRVAYDTVVVSQQDVPCLSIVETIDGAQANEQKLTFAVGDNSAVIGSSVTATNGLYINTNRPTSSPGYSTTAGTNVARFLNNGYSIFMGNVGIGNTGPTEKLLVNGSINSYNQSTNFSVGPQRAIMDIINGTKLVRIGSVAGATTPSGNQGEVGFIVNNSIKAFIDKDGNFGINDQSPSYKLDVTGTIRATGDIIAYSDARVKENIKTIDNALNKIDKLRGVEFNKIGEDIKSIGVIAQEIEKVIPEVVREDDKGMKSVAYGNISGLLIEAIKELKAEIDLLKSKPCTCNKCNCNI